MNRPLFATWKPKCSECGAEKTNYINKDGSYKWYRNQTKGIGFWCKACYWKFYTNKRKEYKGRVGTVTKIDMSYKCRGLCDKEPKRRPDPLKPGEKRGEPGRYGNGYKRCSTCD